MAYLGVLDCDFGTPLVCRATPKILKTHCSLPRVDVRVHLSSYATYVYNPWPLWRDGSFHSPVAILQLASADPVTHTHVILKRSLILLMPQLFHATLNPSPEHSNKLNSVACTSMLFVVFNSYFKNSSVFVKPIYWSKTFPFLITLYRWRVNSWCTFMLSFFFF